MTTARVKRRGQRVDVVAFGEVLWDLSAVSAAGAPPRQGAPLDRYAANPGGATSNLAIVLARLGVRVGVVAGVGDDFLGEELTRCLEEEGIDVRGLLPCPQRTGVTFIRRGSDGEPSFLNYRQGTADLTLRPRALRAWPHGARWLVVGSTHVALPPMWPATRKIVADARRAGAHVAVDLNARRFGFPTVASRRQAVARLLAQASIVKASSPDLVALGFRDLEAGHAWLSKRAPAATLLLTAGARGASAHGGHGATRASRGRAAAVVDAAGAGDAFLAGVLATLLAAGAAPGAARWSDPEIWTEALAVGHSLGRKVVSRVGGTTGARDLSLVKQAIARVRRKARRP